MGEDRVGVGKGRRVGVGVGGGRTTAMIMHTHRQHRKAILEWVRSRNERGGSFVCGRGE